jgi:HEAT repeat protein
MNYTERAEKFEATLSAAAASSDADHELAGMLSDPALDMHERSLVAAALGGTRGPAGSAAVRKTLDTAWEKYPRASKSHRPWERDLICTCVIALARRDGSAATDVYVSAALHENTNVRRYGLYALAAVGDDRAWETIMTQLAEILKRKITPDGPRSDEASTAAEYLARHSPQGSERAIRLITLLREQWRNLGDPDLLERWWPGIEPGGSSAAAIDLPGLHTVQHRW